MPKPPSKPDIESESLQREPLLATKLYIPPAHAHRVLRPRLTARLTEGLTQPLTLISAPAGFGKTTLLSEWHASETGRDFPLAWLSLDEDDNDVTRFLTYLVVALQTLKPGLGATTLAILHAPQSSPARAVLTNLINELGKCDGPVVLVLDDYHTITSQPIHDALTFLLDHLPPCVHFVIVSRTEPPLPLSRLRARAQLTELRAADLLFTPDEAAAFLNDVMRLQLSSADVSALEKRTEGWIAGLQLAALSLRGRHDAPEFIKSFTGSHRHILDYLIDEVLDREPELIRTFLMQTSILNRLNGALCNAVTGGHDGQELLEQLETANLFLIPLDYERRWYRYHHLFGDLLRQQLSKLQPDRVPILHRHASEWYEQNGLLADAVHHALVAQDFERAANLIEQAALVVLGRGEMETLVGWLNALSDDSIRARPWLCVFHAWMLILTGQGEAIETRLRDAEAALKTANLPRPEASRIRGYISAIRAQVSFIRSEAPTTIEYARDALPQLTAADRSLSATTATILGAAYSFIGDLPAAIQSFEKAKAISLADHNHFNAILASSALAQVAVLRGRLHEAEQIYRDSLQLVESDTRSAPSPGVGYAYVGLADVLREWNELESAAHYAAKGMELCLVLGQAEILRSGYLALARVQRAQGNIDGALATLAEASRVISEISAWSVEAVAAQQARLWLTQGNLEAAAQWAQHSGRRANEALSFNREAEHLTLARVLMALDQRADAARLLKRLGVAAQAAGRTGSVIEISILQALNDDAQGERARALESIEQALTLARPEGHIRIFVDESEPLRALLEECRLRLEPQSQVPLLTYVDRLLEAYGGRPLPISQPPSSGDMPKAAGDNLIEPLTDRELEVLRLLAAGLSNREIAEQLVVSVNTVKAHAKSINSKLNAHNRTQAVNQAQELGLL